MAEEKIELQNSTIKGDVFIGTKIIKSEIEIKSILPDFLNKLNDLVKDKDLSESDDISMGVEDKINHNNFQVFGEYILDYYCFFGDFDIIIDRFVKDHQNFESRFFKYLKLKYDIIVSKLIIGGKDKLEIVRENSDKIWSELLEVIESEYYSKYNSDIKNNDEITKSIIVMMCRAFSLCKIFEKVKK